MITRAQLRAPKGESRVSWGELGEFHEGLLALTGDAEGPLYGSICRGDRAGAEQVLQKIVQAFGKGEVFVEVQRHRVPDEERITEGLCQLAQAQHLPVVATNGVLYAEAWGRDVLDVFSCIRHHTHLDAAGLALAVNAQREIKTPQEMAALFSDLPEALSTTERIAERLEFTLSDLGYEFPRFPTVEGETMDGLLRRMTYAGAEKRFGTLKRPVLRQLEKELALIGRLNFSGYFLIVWDIVNFARSEGILVQGRGSAANSAVCYALGITAVDPIKERLLFERF